MTTRIFFSQSRIYAWFARYAFSRNQRTTQYQRSSKGRVLIKITQWAAMNHRQNLDPLGTM